MAAHLTKTTAHGLAISTILVLINFYHMTLGKPHVSSWINGINTGWFDTWPGLTAKRVRKYCTKKLETAHGHLHLIRQHINYTTPVLTHTRSKEHRVETQLIDDLTDMVVIDTTGRYPITSNRGHKYVFVMINKC